MKYDRLVMCGESYMEPLITAKGHLELAKQLDIPETKVLVYPGSAIDQVARELIDYVLTNLDEKLLIVWGLTFTSRFDILATLKKNYPSDAKYISYNGNQFNAVRQADIYDYYRLTQAAEVINETRSYQHDLRLKEYLNKVITTISLIKQLGHDYLVFSQVKLKEKEFNIDVPQEDWINQEPAFLDIFNFQVNEYLQTQGAEPEPKDFIRNPQLNRANIHLKPTKELVDAFCKLIIENYNRIYA